MLKTPANERRKTCAIGESAGLKTLAGSLCTSVVEPSVLNTPEEPGTVVELVVCYGQRPCQI